MAETQSQVIHEVVEQYGKDRTRLMDIARALNARLGYLSEDAIGEIAGALGVHRVEVRDMVSFYAFLSREPKGKYEIRLCNAVVERMLGADAVAKAFEEAAGCPFGSVTKCGTISLDYTPCIGLSDQGPSALVNGVPLTNLKPSDVPGVIAALRRGDDPRTLPNASVDSNIRQAGEVVFAPIAKGAAVRKASTMTAEEIIGELNKARVRGRGGAGFPTAMKWDFCRKAKDPIHYVICNADEGEPGTFKDREILRESPDLLFEGMTVAALALGAEEGFLYLRAEYAWMLDNLERVLHKRRELGLLGNHICGIENRKFDIRIQAGAGAYVCGEESALIESLEGKRGAPRDRPPFPVQKGYLNKPTSVNNVETYCAAARIIEKGADWFSRIGTKDSTGTKLLSVSGDCARPGVYELPYGITIGKVLELAGADNAIAVQIAGPSGQCLAPKDFGRTICFEDLPTGGSFIVFGPGRDILEYMKQFIEFFCEESCGWCVPCRAGTSLMLLQFEKILEGKGTASDVELLRKTCDTVKTMSRCGLGQTAANPILSSLRNLPELYDQLLSSEDFVPPFDLAAAMREGCEITGRTPAMEEEHA